MGIGGMASSAGEKATWRVWILGSPKYGSLADLLQYYLVGLERQNEPHCITRYGIPHPWAV